MNTFPFTTDDEVGGIERDPRRSEAKADKHRGQTTQYQPCAALNTFAAQGLP